VLGKKKFLIGGIIVVLAISSLVYTSFMNAATYYYEVNEFLAQGNLIYGENVRVNGEVIAGSIEKDPGRPKMTFTITKAGESLLVVYEGAVPDTFKPGADIVVEGQLNPDGIFEAHTLMAKCASKYEPIV